jgi:hypothetical protein
VGHELACPLRVDLHPADARDIGGGGLDAPVVGRHLRHQVGAEQSQQPPHRSGQRRGDLAGLPDQQLLDRGGAHGQQHDARHRCASGRERRREQRPLAVSGEQDPARIDLGAGPDGVQGAAEVIDVVVQADRAPVAGTLTDAALVVPVGGATAGGQGDC